MKTLFTPSAHLSDLQLEIGKIIDSGEAKGLMILACDNNAYDVEQFNLMIQQIKIPVFGGIFPSIINGYSNYDKGAIVAGMQTLPTVEVIENISNSNTRFDQLLSGLNARSSMFKSMIVFIDGFSQRISDFTSSLFNNVGFNVNYIGGGAGSLSMQPKPCIITNKGLLTDAAVVAGTSLESGIGVNHGWDSISEPLKITDSEKNTIKTINFKPAFEVYKEIVELHSHKKIYPEKFFEMSKSYPFGINKMEGEKIIRDPVILTEKGELVCVGEIPKGAWVEIMHGDTRSLIRASNDAFNTALETHPKSSNRNFTFFIDCISRALFLENSFKLELTAVYDARYPHFGALTIGEIANNGTAYLEFYNKTAVVGCF